MLKNNIVVIAGLLGASFLGGCGSETSQKTTTTTTETTTETQVNDRLPQDVATTCTVSPETFNSWFTGGKAIENGKVMAANSVTFPDKVNCDFYQWSEQMFLWLLSPAKGTSYAPGNTVMEDTVFYDVSEEIDGNRTMTRHNPGTLISVSSAIKQTGPNGLPVVIDDKGELLEVEAHNEKTIGSVLTKAANGSKQNKKVAKIEEGADPLHHIFKDEHNVVIEHPRAILQHTTDQGMIVEEFEIGGKKVFIDTAGYEHTISVGQATGDVLMAAQNNSLVYYAMMVNDVYAYYLTAYKENVPFARNSFFPTTDTARNNICAYARKRGIVLPDSNALAIELKLALVETTGLKDPDSYVTIDAMVPDYDTTDKHKWVAKGTRKAKLALIGIHVVGSVAGNPEMIWATFEHKNNAPNGAYDYVNREGKTISVPADSGIGWVLCNSTSVGSFNVPFMINDGLNIESTDGHVIAASPTQLINPFGTAKGSVPNPENKSAAESNSQVISINNSVISQLVGKDVRKHYRLIGATWTQAGANPTGKPYSPANPKPGVAVGTNLLINSAMETYDQTSTGTCFRCHKGKTLSPGTFGLSHIFSTIIPLPKVPASMKK